MPVQLNHTIVHARNKQEAATFFREILALPEPVPSGPFLSVQLSNDVTLDFADYLDSATAQHYAFLVTEDHEAAPPIALIAPFARVARSTNRSTPLRAITGCQLQNVTAARPISVYARPAV